MGLLEDFEKDKVWDRMLDMQVLGMTREDLEDDDSIIDQLTAGRL